MEVNNFKLHKTMSTLGLKKKILFRGKIKLLTGLRIGGSSSAMSIGGLDNIIIRNPIDNKPYIPGSSLKGKMRALIELRDGTIGRDPSKQIQYGVSDNPNSLSCRLFGTSTNDENQHPSYVIFRDASLLSAEELFKNTDVPYAEVKTEVTIDRITSKANPRIMERVPAGAEFELNIVLNIMNSHDENQEKELVKAIFDGLQLIQDDYLGGSGSRGYGQIKFTLSSVTERTNEYYKSAEKQEKEYTLYSIPEIFRSK